MKVPSVLQKDGFRFIKVKACEKIPLEKAWQNERNYSYNSKKKSTPFAPKKNRQQNKCRPMSKMVQTLGPSI